jgi:hypothetical protein
VKRKDIKGEDDKRTDKKGKELRDKIKERRRRNRED